MAMMQPSWTDQWECSRLSDTLRHVFFNILLSHNFVLDVFFFSYLHVYLQLNWSATHFN